ncbi:Uncharacterised protein [Mycobacteroides abscessus subsp. abscessus]|nr:Uncharacterised protein [Mycobacteroides abscessus subsp. abscessus]
MAARGDDLARVVRGHVRRHAHGDARGPVDEEVGERGGQDVGLGERVVVVGDEVDDLFVEAGDHLHRRRRQPRLGVAGCGGSVVEGAEVAVAVDEGDPHDEVLAEPHERVVDRGVAVRVELAHDVTDDARGLDVAAVGSQSHVAHLVDDAPLHRLEAVTGVGQSSRIDDRVGVLEVGTLHLRRDVDIDDSAFGHGTPVTHSRPLSLSGGTRRF